MYEDHNHQSHNLRIIFFVEPQAATAVHRLPNDVLQEDVLLPGDVNVGLGGGAEGVLALDDHVLQPPVVPNLTGTYSNIIMKTALFTEIFCSAC